MEQRTLTVEYVPAESVTPHPRNAREGDVDAIVESITTNGVYRPLYVQASTGYILAGNHTWQALCALGAETVPVVRLDVDDSTATRILLADNRTADLGGYDEGLLLDLLTDLDSVQGTGYTPEDLADLEAALRRADHTPTGGSDGPSLADRFLIPPFTVLDARQGWWRERKRTWLDLGIRSEVGREDTAAFGDHDGFVNIKDNMSARKPTGSDYSGVDQLQRFRDPDVYPGQDGRNPGGAIPQNLHGQDAARFRRSRTLGQGLQAQRQPDGTLAYTEMEGTAAVSIFDPVLCEIVYRWWGAPGLRVLDPYAGGSVRGIVAARLGLHYTGVELRPEQVAANQEQGALLATDQPGTCGWLEGDSGQVLPTLAGEGYNLAFTCPPYLDLERYSDDPADLSTLSHQAFATVYQEHHAHLYAALADDAFYVSVVGSARDKRSGALTDLRAVTVLAAQAAGFHLASDAVLLTPAGSLPVRAGRQFSASRVLGRCHQDVLVFYKGKRKNAAALLGEVDVTDALAVHTTDDGSPT